VLTTFDDVGEGLNPSSSILKLSSLSLYEFLVAPFFCLQLQKYKKIFVFLSKEKQSCKFLHDSLHRLIFSSWPVTSIGLKKNCRHLIFFHPLLSIKNCQKLLGCLNGAKKGCTAVEIY
jgi:hypothetical protein